jgi:hypothetical protein
MNGNGCSIMNRLVAKAASIVSVVAVTLTVAISMLESIWLSLVLVVSLIPCLARSWPFPELVRVARNYRILVNDVGL